MSGPRRFKQYASIIPPGEREDWIIHHIGMLYDMIEKQKNDIAKLKAHNTRQKKLKP